MSELLELQLRFAYYIGLLLVEAKRLGLPVKLGRGLCCTNCASEKSLHLLSLAEDLPMVWPDGRYGSWDDYKPLGDYWKKLDPLCCWGGDFDLNNDGIPKDDANHFSIRYGGRR